MNKQYQTSHQLANAILQKPDICVVILVTNFESEDSFLALPVIVEEKVIQERPCIVLSAGDVV